MTVRDAEWRDIARETRVILARMGHPITDLCMPDEPDPCGGTWAQHAAAHLSVIKAIADHQLTHLGPHFSDLSVKIYRHTMEELAADHE